MGVLDDLQRQFSEAAAAARRQRAQTGRGDATAAKQAKAVESLAASQAAGGTQRIGGRLQRERLEKSAPASPAIAPGPTADDFRRKVEAMQADELESRRALPPNPGFDLGLGASPSAAGAAAKSASLAGRQELEEEGRALTFGPKDIIRAVVLGGILGEPKGKGRQGR